MCLTVGAVGIRAGAVIGAMIIPVNLLYLMLALLSDHER